MKSTKLSAIILFLIIAFIALGFTANAQTNNPPEIGVPNLMNTPIPSKLATELDPGSAAFDPNGLSFTNVNYKVATGTQIESGTGGTLSYLQGDATPFTVKGITVGIGAEITLSAINNGFHSAAADLEIGKNFPNWQLIGKIGYGRTFEDNVGNYAEFGFDVNYNLTRGAGLSWLGTSSGSAFTYVGSGVSWADKDFSLTASQTDIVKSWRIYIGYAF